MTAFICASLGHSYDQKLDLGSVLVTIVYQYVYGKTRSEAYTDLNGKICTSPLF